MNPSLSRRPPCPPLFHFFPCQDFHSGKNFLHPLHLLECCPLGREWNISQPWVPSGQPRSSTTKQCSAVVAGCSVEYKITGGQLIFPFLKFGYGYFYYNSWKQQLCFFKEISILLPGGYPVCAQPVAARCTW